ncbi:hypothetical protein PTKIN_Ptkin13bG0274300 [Pterospermum kingtungense]
MIACNNKEDSKRSEKKMEGDDGLRTVECLRGRLLAERQASKTAKEDAEALGNKLIELENKLKEETKLRNKAENRLNLLRKKLESLHILPGLEESELSNGVSSVSSTSNSSGAKDTEESDPSKSQNPDPEISKNVEENASDTNTSTKSLESNFFSQENSNSSVTTTTTTPSSSHEDAKIDDTSLKATVVDIDKEGRNENYEDDDYYVDNSLALVPLNLPETKQQAPEIKIVSKSIGEVLDTLRQARERIQISMQRRQMIRVRPS